jgi:hypothetical protein
MLSTVDAPFTGTPLVAAGSTTHGVPLDASL